MYPFMVYALETNEFELYYEDDFEPEQSIIKQLEAEINGH